MEIVFIFFCDFFVGVNFFEMLVFFFFVFFLNKMFVFLFLFCGDNIIYGCSCVKEVRVVCVDIGLLDRDKGFDVR